MKRKFIFVLIPIFLVLVAFLIIWINDSQYQELYIYETTDSVVELFESNFNDFDEYVELFSDHSMWDKYYEETKDPDFVNHKGFKKYTTADEFDFLEEFSDKYHPTFWGRKSLGFYVKSGSVQLIKDELLTEHTQFEINRAKEAGATVEFYENGWISIVYSSHKEG